MSNVGGRQLQLLAVALVSLAGSWCDWEQQPAITEAQIPGTWVADSVSLQAVTWPGTESPEFVSTITFLENGVCEAVNFPVGRGSDHATTSGSWKSFQIYDTWGIDIILDTEQQRFRRKVVARIRKGEPTFYWGLPDGGEIIFIKKAP